MVPGKKSAKISYCRSLLIVSYYWGLIFCSPVEFQFPAPQETGGFNSLEHMNDEHNIVFVIFAVTFLFSIFRIMDHAKQNMPPRTSDPMAFQASFNSDFAMLFVMAAIIAQVAITAIAPPNLNQVH